MKTWLSKAGPYRIEHLPCPYVNESIDLSKPPTGVLHTTEGPWGSAMSVFSQHYAPDFLVGSRRIAQLKPLGKLASALENHAGGVETNRWCRAQIEVVGNSKTTPYSFDAGTTDALAELLALLKVEAGIPLVHPFSDVMPPQPWATEHFIRRSQGKWGRVPGWYGHVEVPENAHWDCGALRWTLLLQKAQAKLPAPPKKYVYDITIKRADSTTFTLAGVTKPAKALEAWGVADHKPLEFRGRRRSV